MENFDFKKIIYKFFEDEMNKKQRGNSLAKRLNNIKHDDAFDGVYTSFEKM